VHRTCIVIFDIHLSIQYRDTFCSIHVRYKHDTFLAPSGLRYCIVFRYHFDTHSIHLGYCIVISDRYMLDTNTIPTSDTASIRSSGARTIQERYSFDTIRLRYAGPPHWGVKTPSSYRTCIECVSLCSERTASEVSMVSIQQRYVVDTGTIQMYRTG
jgi:hypothetical protein